MFKTLKEHDSCSDYILDLLEYVETNLLRVDIARRAKIDDIVKKFEALDNQCRQSLQYRSSRKKEARTNEIGLSEIVELPEYQEETLADGLPLALRTHSSSTVRQGIGRGTLDREPVDFQEEPKTDEAADCSITTKTSGTTQSDLNAESPNIVEDVPTVSNHQPVHNADAMEAKNYQKNLTANDTDPDALLLLPTPHSQIMEQPQNTSMPREDTLRPIPQNKNESVDLEPHSNAVSVGNIEHQPESTSSNNAIIEMQTLSTQDNQKRVKVQKPSKKSLRVRSKKKILKIVDFCFGSDEA
jgi:hypothetical protein